MLSESEAQVHLDRFLYTRQKLLDEFGNGREKAMNAPSLIKTEGVIQGIALCMELLDYVSQFPQGGENKHLLEK